MGDAGVRGVRTGFLNPVVSCFKKSSRAASHTVTVRHLLAVMNYVTDQKLPWEPSRIRPLASERREELKEAAHSPLTIT